MPTRFVNKTAGTAKLEDFANAAGITYDTDDGFIKYADGGTARTIVNGDEAQTITNKTFTAPTLTDPVVTGDGNGVIVSKRVTLTENESATSYTGTITIPAGAVIEDIQVIPRVLWNGTSASLDVGDTADPNGFFAAINLKATDAVIGEMFSVKHSGLWGGKEGAYLVSATGQRGPTSSNFATSYVAGSDITFVVTPGAADGTAGRTDCVVIYSIPETVAQVAV